MTWSYVRGISSHPQAVWRASNHLHWADYDAQGCRVAQGADRSCAPTPEELAAWDAQAPIMVARAAQAVHPAYIRWGHLPKGGRSRNHATGNLEAGISVYRARYNPELEVYEYDDEALAGAAVAYMFAGVSPYLVTGREVGTGSDGEPLLRDVRIIGPLGLAEHGFRLAL